MKLLKAAQYKISRLLIPAIIKSEFNGQDLSLVKSENGKPESTFLSDLLGGKK